MTDLLIDLIKKYPDKNWNWWAISANENIGLSDIMANMDLPWDWKRIASYNPNIDWKDFIAHPNLPWIKPDVYDDLDFPFSYVLEHLELPWNWQSLSWDISIETIKKHPELPWDWVGISQNETITEEFIKENIDNIDFNALSYNKFIVQTKKEHKEHIKKMTKYFWILENKKYPAIKDINRKIIEEFLN